MRAAARPDRFLYQVTQNAEPHKVTIYEYGSGSDSRVLLAQVPDSGDWHIPSWRIHACTGDYLVLRNEGAEMSEQADGIRWYDREAFDTIADRIFLAVPRGDRIIASMGILGDAYVSGFSAFGLACLQKALT